MATSPAAHFAAELRAARGRRRLKQGDLAELSGVSITTINRFENEQREPRIGQLVAIAGALGVSPCSLIPGCGPRPTQFPDERAAS